MDAGTYLVKKTEHCMLHASARISGLILKASYAMVGETLPAIVGIKTKPTGELLNHKISSWLSMMEYGIVQSVRKYHHGINPIYTEYE